MIIFLYGENDFKIKQKIKEFRDRFTKEVDNSGQNIFVFDGEKIKLEEISGQISSGSLFCSKKMVIISDFIKNKQKNIYDNFLDYLQKNKASNSVDIFIFSEKNIKTKGGKGLVKTTGEQEVPLNKSEKEFYNFLTRQKYSQEYKNYNQSELINLVKKELKNNDLEIDTKEANLLIALADNNTWNIHNEIKKLIHFKLEQLPNNKINQADIEKISSGVFSENIFAFTDAISTRNKKLASQILEEQYLAGAEPDYVLSMLLRQFKILLQIRQLLDLNYNSQKIISSLSLHPFIITKGINQAKNFSSDLLKKIINNLIYAEKENRTGNTSLKTIINLIIGKL